jgi:hypothetical protein
MICTLTSTGPHYILATPTDSALDRASETISLHFDVLNSIDPFGATALSPGTAQTGIQIRSGQVVARSFSGNADDKILVSAGNTVGNNHARFRTRVFDSTGTLVSNCDKSYYSGSNVIISSEMICTLTNTGPHYILATPMDSALDRASETISLHFDVLNSIDPFGATALSPGTAQTGIQIRSGQVVARSFSGNADDKILVSAGNTVGNTHARFRTRVFDSTGTLVTSCDKSYYSASNLFISGDMICTLTSTGPHYILATPMNSALDRSSETINLFMENMTNPASADITSGTPPSGTMVLGVPWVRKFSVTAGQTASASLATTTNIKPRVRIIAPNGTAVCNNALTATGTATFSNCSLTQTGLHLMIYSPNDTVHAGSSTTPTATFTWNGP